MSHALRFHFKCPVCSKVYNSRAGESFTTFANGVFRIHTWDHLKQGEKTVVRLLNTPEGHYSQTRDGA